MIARSHCCAILGDCIRTTPTIADTTMGTGWFVLAVAHTPTAIDPNRISNATTLVRELRPPASDSDPRRTKTGIIWLLPFGGGPERAALHPPPVRVDLFDHFVEREPGGIGISEHARDEGLEPPLMLRRRPRVGRRRADERSDAAPRFEHTVALEVRVDARDRVRVHAQLDGELADRRQLIARAKTAGR